MTDFHHISLRRKALPDLAPAYIIEEEEEDYCSYEEPRWPQQQVARPSIAFLVANYAPPMTKPKPLEEHWVQKAADNNVACKKAAEAVVIAGAAYDAKSAELAKAEAESRSINKWSAARTTSAALIKRLQDEATAASEKKKAAVAAHEKIFKDGEDARWMIANQKKREELWIAHKKNIHEDWVANYGKHRALRTGNDLFGHYDVVEKPKEYEDGWTRFVFKAGTDVEHVCRELDMGGHDRTDCGGQTSDAPWVEIRTDVLKAFESA